MPVPLPGPLCAARTMWGSVLALQFGLLRGVAPEENVTKHIPEDTLLNVGNERARSGS